MYTESLKKTPLHALHLELGAKMVPFAGYDMPVQYPTGVLKEHLHCRAAAGLFDVSHMGQIQLRGSGIASALEALMPVDVLELAENRQRYALLTNAQGGLIDDLMVANCGDYFSLVVNAACKARDLAHLQASLPQGVDCELLSDRALLALQGPESRQVLAKLAPAVAALRFMDTAEVSIAGIPCWISCSGYTGEDGFEISVAASEAETLARRLLDQPQVAAIGLGARDSLRLEAGLCLYGHELDESTSPIEASLLWAISPVRRPGGARAGGYLGAARIAGDIAQGVARKRVLLDIEGRAPVRDGSQIVDGQARLLGQVSSGGFGPSANRPIAMAFIDAAALAEGVPLYAQLRGRRIPVAPRSKAYVAQRYYRG